MRHGPVDVVHHVIVIQTRDRATAKLLRPHGGDVDVQKAIEDGSGFFARKAGTVWLGCRVQNVISVRHEHSD